jgi:hypothetical protein
LLQFAVQFSHAFDEHKFSSFSTENTIYNDKQDTNCAVFHDKIFSPAVDFSVTLSFSEYVVSKEKLYSTIAQNSSRKPHFKLSRAPPILLL